MEQSTAHKTIKSASTQTVVTVATAIVTLASFSILSRLLSKEVFGYFAVITAITTIFNSLTEAGMGSAVIQVHKIDKGYVNTAFSLALYLGVFFSVLLILLAEPLAKLVSDTTIVTPLRWMSISVLFCSLNSVTKANMTRKLQFKRIGIYNICAIVLSSGIAIVAAWLGAGVYAVILQTLLNTLFTFMIFYSKLEEKPKWFDISMKYVKSIFSFGGWLTASVIARVFYGQLDKLLMSRWFPVSVLGAYNRPSGFIGHTSSSLNGIFDTVLFPILSSIQDDAEKIRRALGKLVYLINLYSSILSMCFIVASKALLTIFFGPEWTNLTLVFIILSCSLLTNINSRIMDCFIRSLAYVKMGFYLRLLACGITLGCLFAGKGFGLIGIAVAVVVSNYIITLTKLFYIGYKIKYSFWNILKKMFSAQKIILLPVIVLILFYNTINQSFLSSCVSTLILLVYFAFMILCIPGMMGDDLSKIVYSKVPKLKKLLIKK